MTEKERAAVRELINEKLANDLHACPHDVALAVLRAGLRKMEGT